MTPWERAGGARGLADCRMMQTCMWENVFTAKSRLAASQSSDAADQRCCEIKSAKRMIHFCKNQAAKSCPREIQHITSLWIVLQHCLMLQNTAQCTSVAQINLQQRAPWMLSIYRSWLRFLKGIRGFLRLPCSVFGEKRPISCDWALTGDCTAVIYPFLRFKPQW